ncbi:MAG: DUF4870 domain-containing protein [Dehalococcoidales bacterium]|nr:MAG: DUF4870 domain-containing protein [Dehalococcoidales bacterium]
MEFGAKVPLLLGIGVGILVAGIIGLFISILFIVLAGRKPVATTPPQQPDVTPVIPEETAVVAEEVAEEQATEPVTPATVETGTKTSTGLDQNVAGLLCYLFGWVTGIIFLILEKENKLVRFHAVQSIIVFGFFTVVCSTLGLIPFIGDFFSAAIGIITFVVWIVLMIKAAQGEKFKVYIAGDIADKQSS